MNNAKTDAENEAVDEKLGTNPMLLKTVKNILLQNNMNEYAKMQPMFIYKNNPEAIAEIIIGKQAHIENDDDSEEFDSFMEGLAKYGLYNKEVISAMGRLMKKETQQDQLNEAVKAEKKKAATDEASE